MRRRLGRSPLVQNPNPDLRSSASSPENSKNSNPYPTSTIETRRSLPPVQLTRRVSPAKQTKEVTRGTDTPGLSRSLLSVFLRCTRLELHAGPTIPPAVRQLHMALCVRNFDEQGKLANTMTWDHSQKREGEEVKKSKSRNNKLNQKVDSSKKFLKKYSKFSILVKSIRKVS